MSNMQVWIISFIVAFSGIIVGLIVGRILMQCGGDDDDDDDDDKWVEIDPLYGQGRRSPNSDHMWPWCNQKH